MPQGLEIFDESERTVLSLTDRITRILGYVAGNSTSPVSGTIDVPSDRIAGGVLFVLQDTVNSTWAYSNGDRVNQVTISGNRITYYKCYSGFSYGVY